MWISKKKLNFLLHTKEKEYEEELAQQKKALLELKDENRRLTAKLCEYTSRERIISDSIVAAAEKGDEMVKTVEEYKKMQLKGLRLFCDRVSDFAEEIRKKYGAEQDAANLRELIDRVVSGESEDDSNGFDLNEVLNPVNEPSLASLCAELGLTRE